MYSQADFERNKKQRSQMLGQMFLCALPGLALGIVGALLRIEILCSVGLVLAGAVMIFLYDLRLKPVLRYGAYLKEIHSGLQRKTAGTFVRLGADPVFTDSVWFYELILNIYEDLSEDGERRFLLDCTKTVDPAMIGRDVVVTSHGNAVLNVEVMEGAHAAEAE